MTQFVYCIFSLEELVYGYSGELDATHFQNVVIIPGIHGGKESLLRSLFIAFSDVEGDILEYEVFTERIESKAGVLSP